MPKQDLEEKKTTKNFSGQKLKRKRFKDENLVDADFTKADLTSARFINCDLTGADFSKATTDGATFEKCVVTNVRFAETSAKRMRLKNQTWSEVEVVLSNLEGLSTQKVKFDQCKFSSSNLGSGVFFRSQFSKTELEDCNLSRVRAPDGKFSDTKLVKVKWTQSDLVSALLENVSFVECNLSEGDFSSARFKNVQFKKADLTRTEMIACDFVETTFDDCEFKKAVVKYSRGLSEEQLQMVKDKGGKVGLELMRKASNLFLRTTAGRIIFAALVIACVGFIVYRTFVPSSWSYETLRSENAKAREAGDGALVEKYSKIILDRYADVPGRATQAYLDLGEVYRNTNRLDEARKAFEKVLEINKNDPFAYPEVFNGLADIEIRDKNFDKAYAIHERLYNNVEENWIKSNSKIVMIEILEQQGKKEEALAGIEEMLAGEMEPGDRERLNNIKVQILVAQKKYDEAMAILKKQLASDNHEFLRGVYFEMAQIERRRGNMDKAAAIFKEMAERFPEAQDFVDNSNVTKAQELFGEGKPEEAEKLLLETAKTALSLNTRTHALTTLAMHYANQNRSEEAENIFKELFKQADEKDPGFVDVLTQYATFKRQKGEPEESIKYYNKALEISDGNKGALRWIYGERAGTYQQLGEFEDAIKDLEKALSLAETPQDKAFAMINLVQLCATSGDPKMAIEYGKKFKSEITDPDGKRQLMEHLAQAYHREEKSDEVIKIFSSMIDEYEGNPKMQNYFRVELINEMVRNGQEDKAFKLFKDLAEEEFQTDTIPFNFNVLSGLFASREDSFPIQIQYLSNVIDKLKEKKDEDQNYYVAVGNLAETYNQNGEKEKAIDLYRSVIKESSEEFPKVQAYESIFRFYVTQKNKDEAKELIKEMKDKLKTTQGKLIADLLSADLLLESGLSDDAIKVLTAWLDKCSNDGDCCRVVDQLFFIYRNAGDKGAMRDLYNNSKGRWDRCGSMNDAKMELGLP